MKFETKILKNNDFKSERGALQIENCTKARSVTQWSLQDETKMI